MTDAMNTAREALRAAGDFIEDEADNRAHAGSEMSDYEREPRELLERIDAAIAALSAAEAPPAQTSEQAGEAVQEAAWLIDYLASCRRPHGYVIGSTAKVDAHCEAFIRASVALSRGEAAKLTTEQKETTSEHRRLTAGAEVGSSLASAPHHPEAGAPSREASPLAFPLEKVEGFLNGLTNMADAPTQVRSGAAYMLAEVRAALNAHYGHERSPPALKASELGEDHSSRAVPQSTISEGWRLVPREPIREMWAAGGDAQMALRAKQNHNHDSISEAVWQAMWDAAPAPPAPTQDAETKEESAS